jgi:hypothetical protein
MQNPAQVEEPPQTPPMIVDARETEVEDLYRAIRANFDIRGFEVAMNDALLVRGFECLRDEVNRSYRLFMAPGMMHCGGGEGPNQFKPLTPFVTRSVPG